MTTEELSNEFDTLLNSYGTQWGTSTIELDEYEKSVYLTKELEGLVIDIYRGTNVTGLLFESVEEAREYLTNLNRTEVYTTPISTTLVPISPQGVFYRIPNDCLFITYEATSHSGDELGCLSGTELSVVPVRRDEFIKTMRNPFRKPNKLRDFRIDHSARLKEIVSEYTIAYYKLSYIKKPNPVILTDLGDLSINGISTITECELNEILHRPLLLRAVLTAYLSRSTIQESN